MSVYRSDHAQPGQPLLALHHVSRRYAMHRTRQRSFKDAFIGLFRRQRADAEEFWPLKDISFSIYPGDCLGVIGPNGSGKSTLLKLITGVINPSAGDLTVQGRISSLLELGAGFHPDLTGRENIYLNGSIYGMSRSQMDAVLDEIIDYAELGDFIDTPVKHYSSGMYVRLGFAVAIHTQPDLLLVDEVLAVGDAAFQRKCLTSIQHFRDDGGTLILVSHDLSTIQAICRRCIWLEQGEVQADGNPTDVVMAYYRHMAEKEEQKARQRAEAAGSKEEVTPQNEPEGPKQTQRRWGTGQIRITKVELSDAQGRVRSTFHNGDPVTIRLHYWAEGLVEKPVFGLAIYHQSGVHVCGPNTKFDDRKILLAEGAGLVTYHIPSLPLLEGGYTLTIAVVNDSDSEIFDYHDRLYDFQVYRGKSKEQYGVVTLGGVWSHQAGGEAPTSASVRKTLPQRRTAAI